MTTATLHLSSGEFDLYLAVLVATAATASLVRWRPLFWMAFSLIVQAWTLDVWAMAEMHKWLVVVLSTCAVAAIAALAWSRARRPSSGV